MDVLVTGGMGYIGSHTVVELIEAGHHVMILDDLSNSHQGVLEQIAEITGEKPDFYEMDIRNTIEIERILGKRNIDAIIHFASLKSIENSLKNPLAYYENNLGGIISVCKLCSKLNIRKLLFSSSASVYGDQTVPLTENDPIFLSNNPYAASKRMGERIIQDFCSVTEDMQGVILRYFNPIGAHKSLLLGENSLRSEGNIISVLLDVALKKKEQVLVYGNDYETPDGTCIRDYIHIVDLAKAHVKAIEKAVSGFEIFNIGTGRGISVLELIKTFSRVNQIEIKYSICERRKGDIAISYADVEKAKNDLGWEAVLTLEDMVGDSWEFKKQHIDGV